MKICDVILNNKAVTVFDYDGEKIQIIPSINRDATKIKVIKENDRYIVVDDDYEEDDIQTETAEIEIEDEKQKEVIIKKTTNSEDIEL